MVDGLSLRDIFLNTLFGTIERYLATTGTDIAIVGIGHFARTIDDTPHNANLQTYQIFGGSFNLSDGLLQVVERASAARARDIFGLGEFDAGGLENAVGKGSEE